MEDTQVWVLHLEVVTGRLSDMTGGHCHHPLQCKSLLLQVALCLLNMKEVCLPVRSTGCHVYTVRSLSFFASLDV